MSKSVYPQLGIARPGPPKRKNLMPDGYLSTPQASSNYLLSLTCSARPNQHRIPFHRPLAHSLSPSKTKTPPYPYLNPTWARVPPNGQGLPLSPDQVQTGLGDGTGTVGELGRSKRASHSLLICTTAPSGPRHVNRSAVSVNFPTWTPDLNPLTLISTPFPNL